MKSIIAALLLGLTLSGAAAAEEAKPNLLLYISPNEYAHEVRLGFIPYYIVWARRGPALEQAARQALQPQFGDIGMCEGSNGGDVIAWLQPELSYNPMVATYYAKVTARFFRADGKPIGTLTSTGTSHSAIGSRLIDAYVREAFGRAMQDIATQYAADGRMQQAVDHNLARTPCALVALVPNP